MRFFLRWYCTINWCKKIVSIWQEFYTSLLYCQIKLNQLNITTKNAHFVKRNSNKNKKNATNTCQLIYLQRLIHFQSRHCYFPPQVKYLESADNESLLPPQVNDIAWLHLQAALVYKKNLKYLLFLGMLFSDVDSFFKNMIELMLKSLELIKIHALIL